MGFIEDIAPLVQKYAPKYGIKVCSPIIAQAVLETGSGTSELAVNAKNFFGLKYNPSRCPTCIGKYIKVGSEQNADGSYVASVMEWCKFPDMEASVKGYFDFINNSRYSNLKGVTDPETYLKRIRQDGYATSLQYVEKVMEVIRAYGLTKYDFVEKKNMTIAIHAGHNPSGKIACGAVGLLNESDENRKVANLVSKKLNQIDGYTVYDVTVDDGKSQNDILQRLTKSINSINADLSISVHFNSAASSTANGTEVFIYSTTSKAKSYAEDILKEICSLGFKNRGVKTNNSLYVLKNTNCPSLLIECCFVGNTTDYNLYNAEAMANAIVKGISGQNVAQIMPDTKIEKKYYRVNCGSFKNLSNAQALQTKLKNAGFQAIIKNIDGLYKVQVAACSYNDSAQRILQDVKAKGFSGFIVYN